MSNTVSQQFYENILANSAKEKRIVSLGRIKAACDAIEKQSKTKPYTVADVGRYCENKWGGPKTQSIRNAADVLEKYVKLRMSEHADGLSGLPEVASGKKGLNLADPALAQQQYMLAMAQIEQLIGEVARLKVDVGRYAPLTTDQLLEAAKNDGLDNSHVEVLPAISSHVRNAIRLLFNPERLRSCELLIDQNGYLIHDVSGNELLNADDVVALKSLI